MDTDNLVQWVACGDYNITPQFRNRDWQRAGRSVEFQERLVLRLRTMLGALAHDSCRAVLLRTEREKGTVAGWLRELADEYVASRIVDGVLSRIRVMHPAAAPRLPAVCLRKWTACLPVRIAFCGRSYSEKLGDVALECMHRVLVARPGVEFVYIGRIPEGARAAHAKVLGRITHHPSVTRDRVLDMFDDCHLLFHTAVFETAGAVFTEAMAAGIAILAPYDGIEHLRDWCRGGGAAMVDRSGLAREDVVAAFTAALIDLIDNRPRAEAMGRANYQDAVRAWSEPGSRNSILRGVYEDAHCSPRSPLQLKDMAPGTEAVVAFGPGEFEMARTEYVKSANLVGQNFYPVLEL